MESQAYLVFALLHKLLLERRWRCVTMGVVRVRSSERWEGRVDLDVVWGTVRGYLARRDRV